MRTVNLLWTGGWDSTFRLIELSRNKIEITPIYVIDPNRESTDFEFRSMYKILNELRTNKQTKRENKSVGNGKIRRNYNRR